MDKVKFIEIEGIAGIETHAIIDRGNGEFTSMPKAVYDELQKKVVIDEPATKSE